MTLMHGDDDKPQRMVKKRFSKWITSVQWQRYCSQSTESIKLSIGVIAKHPLTSEPFSEVPNPELPRHVCFRLQSWLQQTSVQSILFDGAGLPTIFAVAAGSYDKLRIQKLRLQSTAENWR